MKNKNYSFKVTEDCRLLDFLIDHIPESRNTVKHLMGAGFAAGDIRHEIRSPAPRWSDGHRIVGKRSALINAVRHTVRGQ